MDAAAVGALFSSRLDKSITVESLHQTFPGQSQETWIVEATVEGSGPSGFVLRINPPGGGIVPMPLRREWDVYRLLWPTDIPVGEPLWYDEDASVFDGRPYFVRDLVDGSSVVDGLQAAGPEGDRIRREVAFAHAEALAALHTLDWRAAGFGDILEVPDASVGPARAEFDYWTAVWHDVKAEAFPAVTRSLDWFEANLPAKTDRVSLLKGNNGMGEEIWRDTEIVALSDWELASLGDPAQDWAFSQGMLHLHDPDEVLAFYATKTGFEIDRASLDYWTVWTAFKSMCCTAAGLRGFLDGRDLRPVLPVIGFGSVHLGQELLAHLCTLEISEAAATMSAMAAARMKTPVIGTSTTQNAQETTP